MLRRRLEWVTVNGPCRWCGGVDRLQVDHVDPATKVSHRVWSWSKWRRDEELRKCQVLCFDCHTKKTSAMRPVSIHGTHSCYSLGCHCPLCTEGERLYARDLRARHRASLAQPAEQPPLKR